MCCVHVYKGRCNLHHISKYLKCAVEVVSNKNEKISDVVLQLLQFKCIHPLNMAVSFSKEGFFRDSFIEKAPFCLELTGFAGRVNRVLVDL